MKNIRNVYIDDKFSHYVIINKKIHINADYSNIYI